MKTLLIVILSGFLFGGWTNKDVEEYKINEMEDMTEIVDYGDENTLNDDNPYNDMYKKEEYDKALKDFKKDMNYNLPEGFTWEGYFYQYYDDPMLEDVEDFEVI